MVDRGEEESRVGMRDVIEARRVELPGVGRQGVPRQPADHQDRLEDQELGGAEGVGRAVNEAVIIAFMVLFALNSIITAIYFQVVPQNGL